MNKTGLKMSDKGIKTSRELLADSRIIDIHYRMLTIYPGLDYLVAEKVQVSKSIERYLEKEGIQKYSLAIRQLETLKDFLETEQAFMKLDREAEPNGEWTPEKIVGKINLLIKDIRLRNHWEELRG